MNPMVGLVVAIGTQLQLSRRHILQVDYTYWQQLGFILTMLSWKSKAWVGTKNSDALDEAVRQQKRDAVLALASSTLARAYELTCNNNQSRWLELTIKVVPFVLGLVKN